MSDFGHIESKYQAADAPFMARKVAAHIEREWERATSAPIALSIEQVLKIAEAAIRAMGSPTERMLDMGEHFYAKTECGLMGGDSALCNAYGRMIDEALQPDFVSPSTGGADG